VPNDSPAGAARVTCRASLIQDHPARDGEETGRPRGGGSLRKYELVTVLRPDIGDDDVQQVIERLQDAVRNRGGQVEQVDHWGRRKLAYPIKKYFEGNYVLTHLQIEPQETQELERGLLLSEDVIRHLLVRLDE
jgi:small subunit ribosomal protein S6